MAGESRESKQESHVDQIIAKIKESSKQKRDTLKGKGAEMQRISDKLSRGEDITKEEQDLLEKESDATGE